MQKLNLLFSLLFLFFLGDAIAQISFTPAYIIDNNGEKVECLIKDRDWYHNPDSILYMSADSSEVKLYGIDDVAAFEVGYAKYVRHTLMIDQSSKNPESFSHTRKPEFKEQTVFLKVLLEGEKSLLYYNNGDIECFFIQIEDEITSLISKSYIAEPGKVGHNKLYKGQLTAYLGIDEAMRAKILSCDYNERSLMKVFEQYHQTTCDECVTYKKDRHNVMFLSPVLGIDMARPVAYYDGFEQHLLSTCIGLEWEYQLPMNNNRWSVYAEPMLLLGIKTPIPSWFFQRPNAPDYYNFRYLKTPIGIRCNVLEFGHLHVLLDASFFKTFAWKQYFVFEDGERGNSFDDIPSQYDGLNYSLGGGVSYYNFVAKVRFNFNIQFLEPEDDPFQFHYVEDDPSFTNVTFLLAYKFQISK